jgi:hypothetical protein
MTEPETYVLSDLIGYCPFKFQVNSHHEIAKVEADEWLKSYDIMNTDKVNRGKFDMLCCNAAWYGRY